MGVITRRNVLAGGSAAGALAALSGCNRAAKAPQAPNIIFLLADDLGVADVSCYGAPQIRTPAIDSLARRGARFTQAYANSAVCTASRVGIITGRYQYRLRVGLEEPISGSKGTIGLPPEQPTMPSLLKRAGYATYLVGKWHLGPLPDFGPLKSGYDHFWGFRGGAVDYFSHQSNDQHDLWDDDREVEEKGYLTEMIAAHAVSIIRNHKQSDRPFFISVHFNAPHWPWEGPEDEAHSKEIGGAIGDVQGAKLATYTKMVEAMDRQINLILRSLDETGQADNTIVVFTSDNGGERLSNTWPFTGKKTELLEGGIRVPAVVRWPGRIRQGSVSDQAIIHMDWLPTFVAAAGGEVDSSSPSDGINLLPCLTQSSAPVNRTLFWRFKSNAQRAVRDGDFKALKIGANGYLFNVVDDPLERSDLKKKLPDVYRKLTAEWNLWNGAMLPETEASNTYNNAGAEWADHINTPAVDKKAVDDGADWPGLAPPAQ
jgi:arylsulfatase A-like enzyme